MSLTVQMPFILIGLALAFAFGWFAYRRYINQAFEVRQKDWRELLNHAEHEKNTLSLKKDKLEKHLVESNKLLQDKDLRMTQLEQEAKAHGQQYKDMVVAYREGFEEKEGNLTQQIDTLKAKFDLRDKEDETSSQKGDDEHNKIHAMLEQSKQEIQALSSARQELVQDADALQAQLVGAKRENDEIMVEAERQKNSNIELQQEIDTLKQTNLSELSIARTSVDEQKNEYQALKSQYNDLVESSSSLPDSEAVQAELLLLQKNEDGLKDKIAELQEKVRHLEHESRDLITREKERANLLRNELDVVKSEKNQLASQLLKAEKAEKEQASDKPDSTTNIELLKEYQELQTRFDQTKKQRDEDKRHVMMLEKDASETHNQLKEKEIQLIQIQTSNEQNKQSSQSEYLETIKTQEDQISGLQKQLEKQNSKQQDAIKHELAEMKNKLQLTEVDLKLVESKSTQSQKERDDFRQKHLSAVSELERLKVSGAVSQNKILDLNKKLNPVREQELIRKNAELDKGNKVFQQKLNKLSKLEDEHKVLKANLRIAENRYMLESKSLNKELKEKSKNELRLQSQLEKLKNQQLKVVKVASKKVAPAKKKAVQKQVPTLAVKKKPVKKIVKKKPVIKQVKKPVVKKKVIKKTAKKVTKKVRTQRKPASKKSVQPKLGVTSNDDLKRISGVGPKIEKQLHNLGFKRFSDIASMSKAEVAEVNEKLNFKGRIERDKWLVQARKLAKS